MLQFPYSARGACCTAKNKAKWNGMRRAGGSSGEQRRGPLWQVSHGIRAILGVTGTAKTVQDDDDFVVGSAWRGTASPPRGAAAEHHRGTLGLGQGEEMMIGFTSLALADLGGGDRDTDENGNAIVQGGGSRHGVVWCVGKWSGERGKEAMQQFKLARGR